MQVRWPILTDCALMVRRHPNWREVRHRERAAHAQREQVSGLRDVYRPPDQREPNEVLEVRHRLPNEHHPKVMEWHRRGCSG